MNTASEIAMHWTASDEYAFAYLCRHVRTACQLAIDICLVCASLLAGVCCAGAVERESGACICYSIHSMRYILLAAAALFAI